MGYNVDLNWDDEASVWVATSEDIHGLVMEDENGDRLKQRVCDALPELLELNGQPKWSTIQFRFPPYLRQF